MRSGYARTSCFLLGAWSSRKLKIINISFRFSSLQVACFVKALCSYMKVVCSFQSGHHFCVVRENGPC